MTLIFQKAKIVFVVFNEITVTCSTKEKIKMKLISVMEIRGVFVISPKSLFSKLTDHDNYFHG